MISRSTDIRSALRSRQRGFLLNPYRFNVGGDPLFSLVKYGSNFTGTNTATTATDFSSSARAITFAGNAQITTGDSTFSAGSSLLLDGTGDYLTMPDSPDWAPGASTDWCWDFVLKTNGFIASSMDLLSQAAGSGTYPIRIYRVAGTGGGLGALINNSSGTLIGNLTGGAIANSTWTHIAVCMEGGSLRLKINGSHVAAATIGTAALFNSADTMKLGTYNPPNATAWNGWIQCARYTLGNARYLGTGSYTQPTALFPTF